MCSPIRFTRPLHAFAGDVGDDGVHAQHLGQQLDRSLVFALEPVDGVLAGDELDVGVGALQLAYLPGERRHPAAEHVQALSVGHHVHTHPPSSVVEIGEDVSRADQGFTHGIRVVAAHVQKHTGHAGAVDAFGEAVRHPGAAQEAGGKNAQHDTGHQRPGHRESGAGGAFPGRPRGGTDIVGLAQGMLEIGQS